MSKTIQEIAKGLSAKLQLIGAHPGFINIGSTVKARAFYREWRELNKLFMQAHLEKSSGELSYVDEMLSRFLDRFPEIHTTIGIFEVFPPCVESGFNFGCYIN